MSGSPEAPLESWFPLGSRAGFLQDSYKENCDLHSVERLNTFRCLRTFQYCQRASECSRSLGLQAKLVQPAQKHIKTSILLNSGTCHEVLDIRNPISGIQNSPFCPRSPQNSFTFSPIFHERFTKLFFGNTFEELDNLKNRRNAGMESYGKPDP